MFLAARSKPNSTLLQVFPVFIQNLPLRSDFDEVKTVFDCIAFLYQLGHKEIINYLDFIITAGADIIGTEKAPKGENTRIASNYVSCTSLENIFGCLI